MSIYKARMVILDSWTQKGHCPICSHASIRVIHRKGQPDHLACVTCGCAFELEVDGIDIRLIRIGPQFKQKLMVADGIWMPVKDIRNLLTGGNHGNTSKVSQAARIDEANRATSSSEREDDQRKTLPLDLDSLNQEDINRRAIGLAELGNSTGKLRLVLASAGIPEEQIDVALAEVKSRKIKRKSPLPLALAITLIVVVGCLAAAAMYLPKFNPRTVVGQFSPELTAASFPKKQITTTPIPAGAGLSGGVSSYFYTIWNLQGNYNQKLSQIISSNPPVELQPVHDQLIESFLKTGASEAVYTNCLSEYNQNKCNESKIADTPFCRDKAGECSRDNFQYLQEQTILYDYWLGTACNAFDEYYQQNNASFPFTNSNCKYP